MTTSDSAFWLDTFEEHGSSVLAFLMSRVGRRELAEDLLQETFVRVMRRGPDKTDPVRIRSYLFTTAQHLIVDRFRRRRLTFFSEVPEERARRLQETPDRAHSPEALADLSLFEGRLLAVLDALPRDQRVAFEAAVLHQKKYAEVADEQGWTLEKVKISVHRARKKVISKLGGDLRPLAET